MAERTPTSLEPRPPASAMTGRANDIADDIASLHLGLAQAGIGPGPSRDAFVRIIENFELAVEALTKIARPGEEYGWSDKICRETAAAALASLERWWACGRSERPTTPRATPERRAALFVINDLKDKLADMELHDDLPDSHDIGYMAAWREIKEWANGR